MDAGGGICFCSKIYRSTTAIIGRGSLSPSFIIILNHATPPYAYPTPTPHQHVVAPVEPGARARARAQGEKDRPPSEDVAEVAGMIGLTLPASHASWVEVRVCVVLVWSVGWLVG